MGAGKGKVWWIAISAVVAVAIAVISSRDKTPVVEVRKPALGSITQTASAFGRIQAVDQVTIAPDVSGEITEIYVDEGDTIKKSDLLLTIKQDSYLLAVERGAASLSSVIKARDAQRGEVKLRKLEYERTKKLFDGDAVPLSQLEQARAALETAEAREVEYEYRIAAEEASLKAAESELGKTMVYSPMDGVVTSLRVKKGERVVGTGTMAGTEVMTIADLNRMELVVEIGENDICNVKVGDKAEIKPDASPTHVLNGYVEKIALSASTGGSLGSTTDFKVKISIDYQEFIKLLPGMSASAVIITGSKNDILTVPLQAVTIRDGRETVWAVDERQRVRAVPVVCGIQDFSRVEICSGLDGDDLIVTGPFGLIAGGLSEGDKVKTER